MEERLFLRLPGDAACGPETTVPASTLRAFATSGALNNHVLHILSYRETVPHGQTWAERVLPDGAVRLMFDFGDVPVSGSAATSTDRVRARVAGASATPTLLQLKGRMEGLSLALLPGAAYALLGIPAGELEEQALSLEAIWGSEAGELMDHMMHASTDGQRVALLSQGLQRRLVPLADLNQQRARRAAQLVASSSGRLSLREVAAAVNVGERRLQQLFAQHVGMSFRSWSRLARLHRCLHLIRQHPGSAWADVAAEAGFYDQSHLANEFQALCGLSPTVFLRRTAPAVSQSSKTAH